MNILFVYSVFMLKRHARPIPRYGSIHPGISLISARLKADGHRTDLVVLNSRFTRQSRARLREAILAFRPGIVAFTAVYSEYGFVRARALETKREFPAVFLLIGGPHVSLNAEEVTANGAMDAFDALCVGEGEEATAELAAQLAAGTQPAGIRNLQIRRGAVLEKNPVRPFRASLDDLPVLDRAMWARWVEPGPVTRQTVLLGRGCPFDCTYCCNHALRRLASGRYVRLRSVSNVIGEVLRLKREYPLLEEIYFEIETIAADVAWARDLCRRLREVAAEVGGLTYGVNVRITPGNDLAPLFAALRAANFRFVNIGIESGSARVRREVLNRTYSNEDIHATALAARASGLRVVFYNLIGVPGETHADFLETVDVNRRCQPDAMWVSIFYPYPGTKLHALCIERGLIRGNASGAMERRMSVLDLPGFSRRDVERAYVWFEYLVYRGKRPPLRLLAEPLRKRLRLLYFALAGQAWRFDGGGGKTISKTARALIAP